MKKVIPWFLALLFIQCFFPRLILAKDYSIPSATITVQLQKDGTADITEERIYSFDGSYSWADEWIPLKGERITNYELWEGENEIKYKENTSGMPHTYQTQITSDKFYIKWFYSALNENKKFKIKYTIQNAITLHDDISEFYWKLIGDEWSKGTGKVYATVFLPFEVPDDQIWAFGHGPLDGKVSIVENKRSKIYG